MTDKELLDLAARAAGINGIHCFGVPPYMGMRLAGGAIWNPLTNDGDALRLAVKVLNWPHGGRAFDNAVIAMSAVGKLPADPYAATRRAIVRAAAEIGRQM